MPRSSAIILQAFRENTQTVFGQLLTPDRIAPGLGTLLGSVIELAAVLLV